jgi:signal peptidase I
MSSDEQKSTGWLANIKTIIYAVLIATVIRTIAFEPFNIPSGSMIPTLLVGDYLFISKYSYGYSKYSLPFSLDLFSGRIWGSLPQRGDVVVFKYPRDNSTDYIKRVIGLPGDRIQMRDGYLYINDQELPRVFIGPYASGDNISIEGREYIETLPNGLKHEILKLTDSGFANNTQEYQVPPGYVFCMGDNRDNSLDSRFLTGRGVGFVPVENLLGRAQFVFLSLDGNSPVWEFWKWPFEIRWNRILMSIH